MTNYRVIRLEICKTCEFNTLGICRKCGCFVNIKTALKNIECPIKLWGKEQ